MDTTTRKENYDDSTIVGFVGGGGIGLLLMGYIKSFKYKVATTAVLEIALVVIVVNIITDLIRKKVLV